MLSEYASMCVKCQRATLQVQRRTRQRWMHAKLNEALPALLGLTLQITCSFGTSHSNKQDKKATNKINGLIQRFRFD